MGSKERRKGHTYERLLVKKFKELGFLKAQTSRYASRIHDDSLIDLVGIPFHIQAKAVKASIRYKKILDDMQEAIEKNSLEKKPRIIFHKRGRADSEELVIMTAKDFWNILEQLYADSGGTTS